MRELKDCHRDIINASIVHGRIRIPPGDDHTVAIRMQLFRAGAADALASAGDDGNLLRHIVHSFFFY